MPATEGPQSPEKSVSQWLQEAFRDNTTTPEDATDWVIAQNMHLSVAECFSFTRPLIAREAENIYRTTTRRLERKVFDPRLDPGTNPDDDQAFYTAIQTKLEHRDFKVAGETVNWGDATKAQWQGRKLALQQLIIGITKTIRQCEIAMQILDEFNVKCLREIPNWGELARERGMIDPEEDEAA